MKKMDKSSGKRMEIQRSIADQENRKAAWKQYEMRIRRGNAGISELDLDL